MQISNSGYASAFSRHDLPEVLPKLVPSKRKGAGNAGCALHPRSRVQSARKTHTSIQVQRRQSDIPCAMALRLMPRSPRRRIRLVTVAAGLMAHRPGRLDAATGAWHQQRVSGPHGFAVRNNAVRPARCCSLTGNPPCEQACAPDAAASTASQPAFVTIAIRPFPGGTSRADSADLPDGVKRNIFREGAGQDLLICPSGCDFGWHKCQKRTGTCRLRPDDGRRLKLSRCPLCADFVAKVG